MTKLSTRQLTMHQRSETWASNFLNRGDQSYCCESQYYGVTVNNHELTLSLEPRHPLFSHAFCTMLSIY